MPISAARLSMRQPRFNRLDHKRVQSVRAGIERPLLYTYSNSPYRALRQLPWTGRRGVRRVRDSLTDTFDAPYTDRRAHGTSGIVNRAASTAALCSTVSITNVLDPPFRLCERRNGIMTPSTSR